jgi:hypothetical protein
MHSTTGKRSRSRGALARGGSSEVSTGVDFGSDVRRCCRREGVVVPDVELRPGVAGGVKAGESRFDGRRGVCWPPSFRSSQSLRYWAAGRGWGARTGEAWDGRSGIGGL